MAQRRIGHMLLRGVRLRCPRCGDGRLFTGFFTMRDRCSQCGYAFEREQGYFVGAIYINYGATAVLGMAGFFVLDAYAGMTLTEQLVVWVTFAGVFPLWFFRYSRSLWLSLDYVLTAGKPAGQGRGHD